MTLIYIIYIIMSIKECRICYEDENENDKEMINPCGCSGTGKYVHAHCLEQWRATQRGRLGRVQCQECQIFYNISTKFPVERYKFVFNLPCTMLESFYFLFLNIAMVCVAGIILSFDTNLYFIKAFTMGNKELQVFISKNTEDTPFLLCYYYTLLTFLSSIGLEFFIFMKIRANIIIKKRYWEMALMPYSVICIFNMHFLYLYLLTFGRYYEPWIFISSGFSFLNYVILGIFCWVHNRIINRLNIKKNKEIILNYNPNHPLSYVKKHYHPPYRHNIILHIENNILEDIPEESSPRARTESESTTASTDTSLTSSSETTNQRERTGSSESMDEEMIII